MATTGKKNQKIHSQQAKKTNPLLNYTLDQRKQLLLKKCNTRDEFKKWIKLHLELDIPDVTVSRFSDTNPLDAIWEIYNVCANNNNPENIQELLLVAGRGAGKCSAKNTIILTIYGYKYIQDVKVGDIVFTGWDWRPVRQTFDEGILNGIKIVTSNGKTLIGSRDKHRIIDGSLNWKFLKDIKVGDSIYISDINEYNDENIINLMDVGHTEIVNSIEHVEDYFYDLEIDTTHSYWSNGFISHNTLGMAIIELMLILHDQRDVVHIGAIQNQADRCYTYIRSFLYNGQLKDIVSPPKVSENLRILEKDTISKSIFNIDNKKISLEILPCTLKSCLTADSEIKTKDGIKIIKDVKVGDIVDTPIGYKKVIYNDIIESECLEIYLDDGRIIKGTLNHKILTKRGMVELQDLTDIDEIV